MEHIENQDKITREFGLTSLALKNRTSVFLLIFVITLFGVITYSRLPKELFPDVNYPTIFVQTTYFGNPPADIENLITRPLEKELKTVKGINELRSTSAQDASMIFVEFNYGVDLDKALQDVKDAVDKAKSELPNDLQFDPYVMELDFSEFPIINVNISGDYSVEDLKHYAEYLEDEFETISEISKVNIKGLNDREIQVNVDMHKLEAFDLGFRDIEGAIANENVSMSGGDILLSGTRRSMRIVGEFTSMQEIENIIVKDEDGKIVYLKDVAEVADGFAEPRSIARLDHQPVVSIQVIKKSGENLLAAVDKGLAIIDSAKASGALPADLNITITEDQSKEIRSQLSNLENSMIIGVIFVVGILFFFLGARNALFVGAAIPLSMFISFIVLSIIGAKINMITLFSLILALGMLVDNAIVVVENIHRFVDQGYPVLKAARYAVGEIAVPIISSTATTLAAFFPLIFWQSLMGEFMKYLPITLIIVLTSSLFVALVVTPVLSSAFIKRGTESDRPGKRRTYTIAFILLGLAALLYLARANSLANLLTLFALIGLLNLWVLFRWSVWFQEKGLVWLETSYLKVLNFILVGRRPLYVLISMFGLMIVTMMFFGARKIPVLFFPDSDPQYTIVYAETSLGTDVLITDSIMKVIEADIEKVLEPYREKGIVESVLTTVGEGVTRQNQFSVGFTPNKAMTTINFVDYQYRNGISTSKIQEELANALLGRYPGVDVFIEKSAMGPPVGYPVNVEIVGEDLSTLIRLADSLEAAIEAKGIQGIENLKLDMETNNPELQVTIDREAARRFGLSTMQIAGTIRTALYGSEVSDYKEGEDEYPIQVRFKDRYRYNLANLMDQKITFRNNMGKLMQVPISAVAQVSYSTTYGSIRRVDMDRVLTLYSNVLEGYNANEINAELKTILKGFEKPDGYEVKLTGEQEEQAESMEFMMMAMLIAVVLITVILVTQFNSYVKPLIIMTSVMLSTIGVFGGLATFRMEFIVIMTGIGIISLAGVVVNNAIVLIDYTDFLKANRKKELGLEPEANLPIGDIKDCVVKAGNTRLRPVLLTAITTILGLVPMALGVNINFATLLSDFDPQFYFGGDNAAFWGPMSWTVIFGLTFATFMTLFLVPALYFLANYVKLWFLKRHGKYDYPLNRL